MRCGKPDDGLGKWRLRRLSAVRDQIHPPIAIHIPPQQSVNPVEFLADDAQPPWRGQRIGRLLKPHDQSRLVPGGDIVQVPIAIDIKRFAMDKIVPRRFV